MCRRAHLANTRASFATLVVAALLSCTATASFAIDYSTLQSVWSYARAHAVSVFDARRQRLIVLGGVDRKGPYVGTAVLDLARTPIWETPTFLGVPDPSFGGGQDMVAVYDAVHDRVLLFVPLDPKVYSLSLAPPMTWSSFTPSGGGSPSYGMTGAYDPATDRVVLFGGYSRDYYDPSFLQSYGGTMILSLSGTPTWSSPGVAGTPPPGRANGVAVWDTTGHRMILQGGRALSGLSQTLLSDTYEFSFVAGVPTWNPLLPTGYAPAMYNATGAFDSDHQRLLLWGNSGAWELDVGDSTRWVTLQSPNGFYTQWGASGFDPVAKRFLVSGGAYQGGHGETVVGGTWQLPLAAAAPGPWSPLLAAGDPGFPVRFAGYDSSAHRFAGLVGATPLFLSPDDSTWRASGDGGPPPVNLVGPFYDASTNTMYALSRTDLFTIRPGPAAAWTQTAIPSPQPAPFDTMSTAFFDRKRGRILVFGGAKLSAQGNETTEFWQLALGPTPAWTKIADTTPIGNRITPALEDVRRDRLLFFGGEKLIPPATPTAFGDLWSLDLPTLTWSSPAAAGFAPSARYHFAATYDSTHDRVIVFGGESSVFPLPGKYDLQFGPSDPNGTWARNDPEGVALPAAVDGIAAIDGGRDRMYVADSTHIYTIRFGPNLPPISVTPPTPQAWTAGAVLPMGFEVTQGVAGARSYAWSLVSRRNWPGLPLQGTQNFPASGAYVIGMNVPVPDTAAAGVDTLTFLIYAQDNPSVRDSCIARIFDPSSSQIDSVTVQCPLPATWTAGVPLLPLHFVVTHNQPGSRTFDWQLAGTRAWPGMPVVGSVASNAPGTSEFDVNVPVPDTAAAGTNTLAFTIHDRGNPTIRDSCATSIHGLPAGATTMSCPAPAAWLAGTMVPLTFSVTQAVNVSHSYAWRVESARAWPGLPLSGTQSVATSGTATVSVGVPVPDTATVGSNALLFAIVDLADLSQRDSCQTALSAPASVSPGPTPLAFGTAGALVVHGAFDIPFSVPAAGAARIDAYDLRGRHVGSGEFDAGQAGTYSLQLAAAGALRPGVYFLRLIQGGRSVSGRVLLLGAP